MPFKIHASKNGQSAETQRNHPIGVVAKARNLEVAGWGVYVTDLAGRHFSFAELDNLEPLLPSGTPAPGAMADRPSAAADFRNSIRAERTLGEESVSGAWRGRMAG